MKNYILLLFTVISITTFSQNPNHANRGQTLTTRISSPGMTLTVSSGIGSSYLIYLTQGSYQINSTSYFMYNHVPYLGFADSASATFTIPLTASPGPYTLHLRSSFNTWDSYTGVFLIDETYLQGHIYFDANQNGIRDPQENGMAFQNVIINPGGTILQTDYTGKYGGYLANGTMTDSVIIPPNFILTSPSSLYTITLPPDDTIGNDFGLYTPADTILVHNFISATDRIRCNRSHNSFWHATSLSNNIQTGTVTIIYDTTMSYLGSSPVPDYISGDTLSWNYTLQPFESLQGVISFMGGAPNTSCSFIVYDSLNGFAGNSYVQIDTVADQVHCSYDPNDKSVEPAGADSIFHYTELNAMLTYFIRFQNCGNDTAFDISIRDTIDSDLDLSTFQLRYSSSPVNIQMEPNGYLRFMFTNILLPDSNVDEPNSHGILIYSIAPKSTVTNNTIVKNKAYIFFDVNYPVRTNETLNTLVNPIPNKMDNIILNNTLNVFPNPLNANSVIEVPINGQYTLKVFDVSGREIFKQEINDNFNIGMLDFTNGIYYYKVIDTIHEVTYDGKIVVIK